MVKVLDILKTTGKNVILDTGSQSDIFREWNRQEIFNLTLAGGSALNITPKVRGAFMNLYFRHTRADLLRATMESISLDNSSALPGDSKV